MSFTTLELGRIPGWHYINLFGNVGYHAIASARVVSAARSPAARILDPIPAAYETALNEMVATMPARNTLVSDGAVFARVKGSSPTSATAASFVSANQSAVQQFFGHVGVTRHCISRAQLLGWKTPPGEEWHDMLLVEFAWEYLM